jgi:arylsulfatase A-like enzyme
MMTQPNILWICTDQQRWDTLSCLGFPAVETPHIDALAARGVAFRRAYTQSPICTPSRASFLTGMYPIAHQVHRNGNDVFPEHLVLLPRLFKDAGYATGLIGKLHLSATLGRIEPRPNDGYDEFYWSQHPYPDWPAGHDYQDWLIEKGVDPKAAYALQPGLITSPVTAEHHQVAWARERAQDFIRRHAGRPWLLSINLYDPHPPFDPPKSYLDRFRPEDMPPPIFADGDLAHQARLAGIDNQTSKPIDPRRRPHTGNLVAGTHNVPPEVYDAQAIKAAYYAMIAQIDDMVGALTATLDETGQRRDTLVLFMSDHGEMLGDHGLLYKGCRFYDGLVRVPLVVSWPDRCLEGVISDALVELVDVASTLLEAAGLPLPDQNQGRSLLPLLEGHVALDSHKPYVLSEYFDAMGRAGFVGSRASMYCDGHHKLVIYHDAGLGELFDLDADPSELTDLWDDPACQTLRNDLILRHFSAMMMVSGKGPRRVAAY